MCVITSTIAATVVPAVISAVTSAAVGIKYAINKSKIQKFQAEQNIQQAKIAERNAVYERQEGIEDARERKLKAIQNVGRQKTIIASGNIMTSSATAINVFDDEKLSGEIDALKLIDSSEKRAQSYMDSAQIQYTNAAIKKQQSKNTLTTGLSVKGIKLGNSMLGLSKNLLRS
ncbi:MAG: hypothetical protein ACI37R_01070 [Candidatus Avigastranaerophilus sp.]